uniref:Uncharacterized protein n=1 Tax=Cucumis melo TaxID=3656 RepID=A0A9I9EK69_CUCME
MDAARSVVSTNDVTLNHSCKDMGVGVSYVRAAQHRWPNKPPTLGRNEYGFILGRLELVKMEKLKQQHWMQEEPNQKEKKTDIMDAVITNIRGKLDRNPILSRNPRRTHRRQMK